MHGIVEKGKKLYQRDRKHRELTRIEPANRLFKVVVNNYSQQENEILDKIDGDSDPTMLPRQLGLPPQPTRYLKYSEFDWF